ncbi:GrdX family protein [Peptoclostridium sp. AF21-18]|uniref:GrdX family protein n=1 Tax=Peptoclostridium sp. AF21-18 TaxID=2292243 RepID=UPI000E4DA014|nr:GrdX family protein [Peptoclostridium sp. AF21-18]RHQ95414.1 GrdX protein [Peptoclostridium sp. AF21-18]
MFEKEKCTIVTNNDRVADKYKDIMKVELVNSYEEVLIKARDMVYDRHRLLTHPQAGSLKPNQTPYRSIIVYPSDNSSNMDDVMMIEKAIETFNKFREIKETPKYEEKIANDYKTIDLSMIDNVMPRIQ